ncbi:MAG: Sec-independent protein translocase protein TatB [Granulosicoccus sp.]|nr:Sec-independent protein translocase protein TatB [Granulosicoccus sp.]
MFDVGFTEILLIGIISLIVIGPERLPAVAKTVGMWVGKVQRFVRGVKADLASELESGDLKKLIGDQREQISELRTLVDSARKDLKSTTDEVVKSAKSGLSELEQTVSDAKNLVDDSKTSAEPGQPPMAEAIEHDNESGTQLSDQSGASEHAHESDKPDTSDNQSMTQDRTGTTGTGP